ncbi:NADH-ubiquinone oxidoreductase [Intrasporangium oryzae NRRL B-24470]|uniref:NADH-ubiquinone oxidoreductase n=1 Tax=Intrasporangium oryzae NRRL B-24470 TaxID=1386089 RepID=W9G5B4_9MICO|nr:hypothetical protein [Intrasporangium oryzae]EWT01361.1 NADH-ubiquinone oxidoreductase [Intrasporangium oryzae NRRL B-24470]
MRARPHRLNATIAWLFMIGSACFVIGSVPAYANATGGWVDGITYVVGSVFFTGASYLQLVQAQSPAATAVDEVTQHDPARVRLWGWLPHDRSWLAAAIQFPGTVFFNVSTIAALTHNATAAESDRYVWRPDLYGSVLFLVSSVFAVLAVSRRFFSFEPRSFPWRIAWVNLLGSVLFMASAIAGYVMPTTDALVSTRLAVAGTFWGAVCFLVGAALMFPTWRREVASATAATSA